MHLYAYIYIYTYISLSHYIYIYIYMYIDNQTASHVRGQAAAAIKAPEKIYDEYS